MRERVSGLKVVLFFVAIVTFVIAVVELTSIKANADGIALNKEDINVDVVTELVTTDGNPSCDASPEVVRTCREYVETKGYSSNPIRDCVEGYLEVDDDYPTRLYLRYGAKILN